MKINWKPFLRILLLCLGLRLLLGLWMWGVRQVLPQAVLLGNTLDLYRGVLPSSSPWLEPWQRWDTPQYQAIAERGYTAFDTALFTPPLYPLLIRLTALLTGGNTLLAGMIVAWIASLFCLLSLYRMARFELGDDAAAWRTVLYLAAFPTAFFLFAAYTESLFVLAAVLSLFAVRREKWLLAGVWGAAAALTRSPGILMLLPLTYAAWQAWRHGDRRGWLAPVITLAGAALFPLYVWLGFGLPPTAILVAVGRGGVLAFPGWNVIETIIRIIHGQAVRENLTELFFMLLFIVLTIFAWKKLPRLYGIYSVTFMAFFLARLGAPQPLVSMARYVLELFPAFLVLAAWGRRPWVNRLVLYSSWLGLLFFSAQFALWGWVG